MVSFANAMPETGLTICRCLKPLRSLWGRACFALLIVFAGTIWFSTNVSAQQVTTRFRSDASRYVWQAGFDIDQPIGDWQLSAANVFQSEAFLLDDRVTEWRDENRTSFSLTRPLTNRYVAVAFGKGAWFSQNRASTQEAFTGIRAKPAANIILQPAIGIVFDRKPGRLVEGQLEPDVLLDAGPGLSLKGSLSKTQVGQFLLNGTTDNQWHFIQPRFGRSMLTEVGAVRELDRGSLTIDARYTNLRRDSYQSSSFLNRSDTAVRADDSIEATTSDTVDTGILFEHSLWDNWTFRSDAHLTINNRYIRTRRAAEDALFFDTNFNRRVFDFHSSVGYETGVTAARITAARSITEERRRLDNADELPSAQATQRTVILRQADFDRGLFTLQGSYNTSLKRWVSIRSSLRGSILRHDTPISNVDDRDESTIDGDISLRFQPRRGFDVDLRLFGVQHHTVFLNGARSGESNRRRSLRFRPGMRWKPNKSTTVVLETEVRAVYTTDDFSLPNQPKNDQSARELRYLASLSQSLADNTTLELEGSVSKLLLGRLIWEDFKEIPFDTLTTTTASATIRIGRRFVAETGLRVLYRSDFERSLSVRYVAGAGETTRQEVITRPGRERLLQVGPVTEISFPMSKGSALLVSGWVQFQEVRFTLYGEIPEEDADTIRRAANQVERRTIPNLLMTLRWQL